MTMISNNPASYTYRATLIGIGGKQIAARSCALPGNNRLIFESWPQEAITVRVSDFRVAARDNSCP